MVFAKDAIKIKPTTKVPKWASRTNFAASVRLPAPRTVPIHDVELVGAMRYEIPKLISQARWVKDNPPFARNVDPIQASTNATWHVCRGIASNSSGTAARSCGTAVATVCAMHT